MYVYIPEIIKVCKNGYLGKILSAYQSKSAICMIQLVANTRAIVTLYVYLFAVWR